jgi:hypothetical protein
MDRRTFLKRGLLGGALLAAAGTGLFAWPTRRVTTRRALKVLDDREFAILAAVAQRTVITKGADPVEIAHGVDDELTCLPLEVQRDIKDLLRMFDNALVGVMLDGRLQRFTHLAPEAQDAALYAWRDSRIVLRRAGYHALRKLTLGAFYRSPSTWVLSGYPGPPVVPT